MKKEFNLLNNKSTFLINLVFSILEVLGGFLTNSISLISGAIHDLSDSISICISYIFEKISKKEVNNKYSYGYLRFTYIGYFITSILLLIGSILMLSLSIPRLIDVKEVNYDAMILFSVFGILIYGYTAYSQKDKKDIHLLEDLIGWIIILIGSILIKVLNNFIIDPIIAILIALYILFQVYRYLKEVFEMIMSKTPKNININEITKELKNDNIKEIHHIHIWTLYKDSYCMTCHVVLNKQLSENEIINLKNSLKESLKKYKINHTTLEIEYQNENCNSKKCFYN